jgi:hypothetical protein
MDIAMTPVSGKGHGISLDFFGETSFDIRAIERLATPRRCAHLD